jgi:lincosamide and streptogramin A transport system ATP-binding/permease protein
MISIRNLTFGYGGGPEIFKNLSLDLSDDWRLGLVGRNGRGKTTFLRLLAGELAHGGTISMAARPIYFPFGLGQGGGPVGEALLAMFPGLKPWELAREADALALAEACLGRPQGELSPGEATKVGLAALFAMGDVFPLLDEPAGGLDETGRRLVTSYLARKRGFVVVSHDRFLLEGAVDHVLSLGRAGPEVHRGSFGSYWREYEARGQSELREAKALSRETKRLGQAAKRAADWAQSTEKGKYGAGPVDRGYIGHKAAKMAKRAKAVATRREDALEAKRSFQWTAELNPPVSVSPLTFRARRMIEGRGLRLGYGGTGILEGLDLTLDRGERLAVKGPNGSGKSLLLSILAGGPGNVLAGELRIPGDLIRSYVPQRIPAMAGTVPGFARAMGADVTMVGALLHRMGFGKDDLAARVENLSAGQKRKALLAVSLSSRAHLYVWDEPLDFLDVFSRSQIEDLILAGRPGLVFVEHDPAFAGRVATSVLDLGRYGQSD